MTGEMPGAGEIGPAPVRHDGGFFFLAGNRGDDEAFGKGVGGCFCAVLAKGRVEGN